MNTCPKCEATFYYSPTSHRCPGEWEALVADPITNPYEGMSWADECLAKVRIGSLDSPTTKE